MTNSIRVVGALAAPLLLGACGLPIGIQIASLVADGVSFMTTDKTLTDHGISAVTQQDCALWRTVEGKNICRDSDDADVVQTALADTGSTDAAESTADIPFEPETGTLLSEKRVVVPAPVKPATTNEPPKPLDTDKMILGAPEASPDIMPVAPQPIILAKAEAPSSAEKMVARNVIPAPPVRTNAQAIRTPDSGGIKVGTTKRRTYFIIASYHRQADAERFSGRQASFNPSVIEGRAKGRRVFRVAVGPIAQTAHRTTHTRLKKAGFDDTWKLSLKAPKVATQLASLN